MTVHRRALIARGAPTLAGHRTLMVTAMWGSPTSSRCWVRGERVIDAGTAPDGLSGDAEMLVQYTQQLVRNNKVSDQTFNAVKDRFGIEDTVNITGLIGHYLLVGQILGAFEVELGPDMAKELPD